jgi:hypothetical protein
MKNYDVGEAIDSIRCPQRFVKDGQLISKADT